MFIQKFNVMEYQINLTEARKKLGKVILYVIILVLATMNFQKCNNETSLKTALSASNSQTTYYKNRLGTETASKQVLQLDFNQLEDMYLSKDAELAALTEEFSKVEAIVKWRTKFKTDTLLIPFEVKVPCDFERAGEVKKDWYGLGYKVNQNGLEITEFETWNETTVITGMKRKWFWGKETITTDITNTNPFLYNEDVKTIETVVPKKWYQSTLFKVGIGVIGGFVIARQ